MALVRKGSRHITVDGVRYRWQVRRKPTYSRANCWSPIACAVERAESGGSVLVVETNRPHPGNWFTHPSTPVRPAEVAAAIRLALARGWAPATAGRPFHLDLSQGFESLVVQ